MKLPLNPPESSSSRTDISSTLAVNCDFPHHQLHWSDCNLGTFKSFFTQLHLLCCTDQSQKKKKKEGWVWCSLHAFLAILSAGSLLCGTGTSIWFSDNSGNGCREEFELCLVIAIAFFPIPLFPRGGENRIETNQSGSEELIQRVLFREASRDLLFTWTVLCSILQLQTDGMGLDVRNTRVHGVEIRSLWWRACRKTIAIEEWETQRDTER